MSEIIHEETYDAKQPLFQQIMDKIINLKNDSDIDFSNCKIILNSKIVDEQGYNVIDGMKVVYEELDEEILFRIIRGEI